MRPRDYSGLFIDDFVDLSNSGPRLVRLRAILFSELVVA